MVFPYPKDLPPGSHAFAREVIRRLEGNDARSAAATQKARKAVEQTAASAVQASARATQSSETALTAATTAFQLSEFAVLSAAGKNQIVYSEDEASGWVNPSNGQAFMTGDVWWQVDEDLRVIKQWLYDYNTGTWNEAPLSEEFLPLINIGTGTYGFLTGGQLAADAIDGKTITGATLQTHTGATTGIKLDSTSLRAYNGSGVKTFEVTPAGAVTAAGTFRSTAGTGAEASLGPAGTVWPSAPGASSNDGVLAFWPSGTDAQPGGMFTATQTVSPNRLARTFIQGGLSSNVDITGTTSTTGQGQLKLTNTVNDSGVFTKSEAELTADEVTVGGASGSVVNIKPTGSGTVNIGTSPSAGQTINIGYGTQGDSSTVVTVKGEPLNINTIITDANSAIYAGRYQSWSPATNFPSAFAEWTLDVVRGPSNTLKQLATRTGEGTGWEYVRYSTNGGSSWSAWEEIGAPVNPYQGANYPAFHVTLSAGQTKSGTTTTTKIPWGTIDLNNGGYWNTANHRFIAPVDGTYEFSLGLTQQTTVGGPEGLIYKNNAQAFLGPIVYTTSFNTAVGNFVTTLQAGDYVEAFWRNNNNTTCTLAATRCYFNGRLLSV